MQLGQCSGCQQELPRGKMFYVRQDLLCEPCANARIQELGTKALKPGDVHRAVDQTVCTECQADGGERPFLPIGGLPFCPACAARLRRRPFPLWLRAAAVLLVALAVVATMRMVGYTQAALDLRRAFPLAFVQHDLAGAQRAAAAARARVPGSKIARTFDYYFTGVKALQDDDMQQAVSCFMSMETPLEERAFHRDYLIRTARIGLAFDKREYERALAMTQENLKSDPNDPQLLAAVASVSAACYADSGDEKRRQETLATLDRVASLMGKRPAGEQAQMDYEVKRIRHRLETRQVLSRKEYEKEFGAPPAAVPEKEGPQS